MGLLIEPPVSHDKEALVSNSIAPGVLDAVSDWFATAVEMDRGDDHGMGHSALASLETTRLIHIENDTKRVLHNKNTIRIGDQSFQGK